MSVTAAICEDSYPSHFRFCLNLVSCLLRNHSSRRLVNTLKLSEERQQTVNPHYIPLKFPQPRCHQRCSLYRDKIQMTHYLCYDRNETQSECAHRLCVSCAREKTGKGRKNEQLHWHQLQGMRGRIQMTHFLCYDHNETQSECAHRLYVSCTWEKTGKGRKNEQLHWHQLTTNEGAIFT